MKDYLTWYTEKTPGIKILNSYIPAALNDAIKASFKGKPRTSYNVRKAYALVLYKFLIEKNKKTKRGKSSKNLYVELGSEYFKKSICSRYHIAINFLVENGFIEYLKSTYQDPTDLFNVIEKKSYVKNRRSMMYRPVVIPSLNDEVFEFDQTGIVESQNNNPVIQKNIEFQKAHSGAVRVFRDHFMFRYYNSLSTTYKNVLFSKKMRSQFSLWDIPHSIPTFIHKIFQDPKHRTIDPAFEQLFNGDFYPNFLDLLKKEGLVDAKMKRKEMKKLFAVILFGDRKNYTPQLYQFLKLNMPALMIEIENGLGKKAARMETKYLEEIMSKFNGIALTIHDSIITEKSVEKKNRKLLNQSLFEKKKLKDIIAKITSN